jgi:hypothetical protein
MEVTNYFKYYIHLVKANVINEPLNCIDVNEVVSNNMINI